MTPDERLLAAAKRALRYLEAKTQGKYYSDTEDLRAGAELSAAITAVESEKAQDELMVRR